MNLDLNTKYFINSDKHNFVLCERCIYSEKSKTPGVEYIKELAYFGTLEDALNRFLDLRLKDDNSLNIYHLLAVINEVRKEISSIKEKVK